MIECSGEDVSLSLLLLFRFAGRSAPVFTFLCNSPMQLGFLMGHHIGR
jgi:hypothetical protein